MRTNGERKKTCGNCGATELRMLSDQTHLFDAGGIAVTLVGIDIVECGRCGQRSPIIPRIEGLMRTLADGIATKPGALTSVEIRFLRKYLGLSSKELAEVMGADPSTVSRWEAKEKPQSMDDSNERVIRLLVRAKPRDRTAMIERLKQLGKRKPGKAATSPVLQASASASGSWQLEALAEA